MLASLICEVIASCNTAISDCILFIYLFAFIYLLSIYLFIYLFIVTYIYLTSIINIGEELREANRLLLNGTPH